MSDTYTAPEGGAPDSAPAFAPAIDKPMNYIDAAKAIGRQREQALKPVEPAAAPVEAAAPEPPKELADTADASPVDPVPDETKADDPAELPPIEAPRSWSKEDKELFASLPRETQERVSDRERSRESDFLRRQNEAAEKLKGLTAKEEQAERVRQQYESALPALLQTMQEQQQGEFSDIKTMADVEKLAREDWPRYALWDAQQKKIAAVSSEVKAAQDRQVTEFETKWTDFAAKQDQLLLEKAPELADKSKAGKIGDAAVTVLKDIGFTDQELAQLWNGKASLSLRDHRAQLLILDGVKYREAKANAAKPAPKPVPPVQRPGTAPAKGASNQAAIEQAREELSTAKGNKAIEAATKLYQAQRAARR